MTLDQFYRKTLGGYTKEQRKQFALKTAQDCFKAFTVLCTDEANDTFGTSEFQSAIPGLKEMSDYFKYQEDTKDRIEATTSIRSFACCRMWEEYKATYQIDPTFYEVFKNTEKLKVFPTDITRIPVPFFAVDLSRCPCMAEGMYIFVANTIGGVTVCLNVLYEYTVYQSLCTIRFEDCKLESGIITYDWKKSKLFDKDAVGDADQRLRQTTQEIIDDKFNGDTEAFLESVSKVDPEQARFLGYMLDDYKVDFQKELEDLKLFIFQFLTYMSCKNPDIRESRDSRKATDRAIRMGKGETPERIFEVGKRFGKRYELMMKEVQKQKEETVVPRGTHASPIPHLVSAHWHGYWCGKNKADFEYQWVACYFKGGAANALDCDEIVHECEETHACPYSHGEQILYHTLSAMQIEYIPQYRVETGRIFDACVKIHGRRVMIEIDGEQHFKPVANWDFASTQASDIEKNEYCKTNNIPLLRIRYDEILNISDIIKNLCLDTLKGFKDDYWLSEKSKDEYYEIMSHERA